MATAAEETALDDESLAQMLSKQFEIENGVPIDATLPTEASERQSDWLDERDCGFYLTPPSASLPDLGGQSHELLSLEFSLSASIESSELERAANASEDSELAVQAREARAFFESATAKLKGLLRHARAIMRREEYLASAAANTDNGSLQSRSDSSIGLGEGPDNLKMSDVRRQLISGDGKSLADQSAGGGSRLATTASKVRRMQPRELMLEAILGTPSDAACLSAAIENGLLKEIAAWLRRAVQHQKSTMAQLCIRALKHLPVDERALKRYSAAANTVAGTARESDDPDVRQRAHDLMASWNNIVTWPTIDEKVQPSAISDMRNGMSSSTSAAGNTTNKLGASSVKGMSRPHSETLQAKAKKPTVFGGSSRKNTHGFAAAVQQARPHASGQPMAKARKVQRTPRWPAPLLVHLPGEKRIARGEQSQERLQQLDMVPFDESVDTSHSPAEPPKEELSLEEYWNSQWTPIPILSEPIEEQVAAYQMSQQEELPAQSAPLKPS